jgi:primosomal protein N' (replication factor Y)
MQCQDCGNPDLYPLGSGTQKIEDRIRALIPSASILRVDRDSMRKKNALNELYEKTSRGDIDILVGTQMLAKGHDFPKLTLVVVLDADNALYSTDFRASERLFSQLMQVSGRSGRSSIAGEVLIQTSFPNHPIFQAVKTHNYELFANSILVERASIDLPPFSFQAVLQAESRTLSLAERFMDDIADWAINSKEKVNIFGPVRPVMERVSGHERINIYIQSNERKHLQNMLKVWIDQIRQHPLANRVKWSVDIDPM